LDLVKPKRWVMDSQRRRAELEESLRAAQVKSPARPGNHWFPA
jgi:hypothetical protein